MRPARNSRCAAAPQPASRGQRPAVRRPRAAGTPSGLRNAMLLAAAALILSAGCSFTRTSPVKDMYLLDPALPAAVAKPQPGSLRVGTLQVGAPFRARTFVVRDTDVKYQSDFYNEFIVTPGLMLGEDTARALIDAKVFADVRRPGVAVTADWLLDGFVGALYADVRDAARPAAVLEITYYLTRDDAGASAPVWSKVYRRQVPMASTAAKDYVAALNTALSEILAELVRDLAAVPLPRAAAS